MGKIKRHFAKLGKTFKIKKLLKNVKKFSKKHDKLIKLSLAALSTVAAIKLQHKIIEKKYPATAQTDAQTDVQNFNEEDPPGYVDMLETMPMYPQKPAYVDMLEEMPMYPQENNEVYLDKLARKKLVGLAAIEDPDMDVELALMENQVFG